MTSVKDSVAQNRSAEHLGSTDILNFVGKDIFFSTKCRILQKQITVKQLWNYKSPLPNKGVHVICLHFESAAQKKLGYTECFKGTTFVSKGGDPMGKLKPQGSNIWSLHVCMLLIRIWYTSPIHNCCWGACCYLTFVSKF